MGSRAWAALQSAAIGVFVGAVVYASTGTLKVLVTPGLGASTPAGWVVGPPLVLAGGLVWSLVGGALFVLPPVFVAFLLLARRGSSDGAVRRRPRGTIAQTLAVSAAVFLPLYLIGLRGRVVDGALLAIAVFVGVLAGLRQLVRRAAS